MDPIGFDETIYETAIKLMEKIPVKEGIRLLGITISNFVKAGIQLSLFNEVTEKREKIASVYGFLTKRAFWCWYC